MNDPQTVEKQLFKICSPERQLWEEKQFIFIIGSPRSGTTWLQIMLAKHPAFTTTVELHTFSWYTSRLVKAWEDEKAAQQKHERPFGLPVLLSDEEFQALLESFLTTVYSKVLEQNPTATHILDKYPGNTGYIDHIRSLIPNAKFIHVLRDGRDVAASMAAASRDLGFGIPRLDAGGKAWKENVQKAFSAEKYGDDYLLTRYEDLLESGVAELTRIFDFCNIEASQDTVSEIIENSTFSKLKEKQTSPDSRFTLRKKVYRKGKAGTWTDDFTPMDRYLFNHYAGDLLCKLGYAEPDWWANSNSQKVRLYFQDKLQSAKRRLLRALAALAGKE